MQRPPRPELGWDDLKVFRAVAVTGSMRAAGIDLSTNASTVSRRLLALERALGVKLFERHPQGLELTDAGQEALDIAERLNGGVDELQRRIRGRDQRIEGVLRVSVAEILGAWSCRVLGTLAQHHTALELELQISDVMIDVERHQVDLVLRVADLAPAGLVGRKIARSGVGLYASVAYVERHGKDLPAATHRWVEWPRSLEHKPAFHWVQTHYPKRRTVLRANSASAVLQVVKSGVGVALLAHCQAFDEHSLICLGNLPEQCSTPVWLLTHRDLQRTAKVRAALDAFAAAQNARGPAFEAAAAAATPLRRVADAE